VTTDVAAAKGDEALTIACIGPLENLLKQVDRQESLAHINQAIEEAVRLKDDANGAIQEFLAKADSKPDDPEPKKTVVKNTRPIRPKELVTKTYLESQADVDQFLDELRKAMEEAIGKNERIEIR